mgnify:CR=1 FL=1
MHGESHDTKENRDLFMNFCNLYITNTHEEKTGTREPHTSAMLTPKPGMTTNYATQKQATELKPNATS